MEAGNRSFDANVPEETNRKVIDHFADINLVYTEHARRNLLSEGLEPRKIYLTGSPLFEVIEYYRPRIASSNVLERLDLERGSYFLLSMHREENVDNAPRLASLLAGVGDLAQHYGLPVVSTTHPRTRQRLGALGDLADAAAIRFLEPFSYLDYLALQCSARCVISDSGSIAEEAAMLDVPAVTVRDAIERPEALDTGGVVLAGAAPGGLLDAVRTMLASRERCTTRMIPPEYAVPDCSERVVKCIVGMTRLQPRWDNLDRPKRRVAR
jgi:UDP-N-acetylglucosamine 2-epimerase (non-hydrolysing)